MRYALLIGRTHGEKAFQVIRNPGIPVEINAEFKRLLGAPGDLAELHLIVSDEGLAKRKKFSPDEATEVDGSELFGAGEISAEEALKMLEEIENSTVTVASAISSPSQESAAAGESSPAAESEDDGGGAGPDLRLSGNSLAEADDAPSAGSGTSSAKGPKRKG